MRLLFDANLSPALVAKLADLIPGCAHVFDMGNVASDDKLIWEHAKSSGYLVVSKDTDFLDMSLLHGAPPKLIFLRIGNVLTNVVEAIIRRRHADLIGFAADPVEACLIVDK